MHQPGDELVRIYLISPQQRPYPPGSLRRAGGPPIGIDHHTRPRYLGTYMQHLLTIDLNDVPEIRTIGDLAGARALALFIADADTNEAFMIEPFTSGTSQTALVPLTDADLTHGEWTGEPVTDPVPRAFDLHPVDVPARAFDDLDDDTPCDRKTGIPTGDLADLHHGLLSANRIGGLNMHWSADESPAPTGPFILQFTEDIVEANLGGGRMYVHTDTAYWHRH